ncbi:MAG: LPS export ABC transporter permease LptF [Deltaproteobacteria bacterium]|nr:LPS export ABC transporter permease LptF [Deltaproteobacteria bacterium]MBW2219212.1 LPS export ABC transporter permease LptF [Deltaproteobacteria bacterium]
MKINSIINRHIFKQLVPLFAINLFFFSFVLLMKQMLEMTNFIVNYGVGITSFLLMLVYSLPSFLIFIIPMSVMISILLVFLQMSSENEIVALSSSGLSIYGLLPPVIIYCLMGCILTGFMTFYGMPRGQTALKSLLFNVISSNIEIGLKERTFNDKFEDVMIYINKIDPKNHELLDVFIEDQRTRGVASTIVAPSGRGMLGPLKQAFYLKLKNGSIIQTGLDKRSAHSIHFDTYTLKLDLNQAVSKNREATKDEIEMSFSEVREYLENTDDHGKQYTKVLMEFHKKFSFPLACLALGILAVPLGVQTESSKKTTGLGIALIYFLLYYLLLSIGWGLSESGIYPPFIGMWTPNVFMTILGIYLLVRVANGRSTNVLFFFSAAKNFILSRLWHNKTD